MILGNVDLFTDDELDNIASTAYECGNIKKLKKLADHCAAGDIEYIKLLDVINSIRSEDKSNITVVGVNHCGWIKSVLLFIGTPSEVRSRIESKKLSLDVVKQKKLLSHKSAVNVVIRLLTTFYEGVDSFRKWHLSRQITIAGKSVTIFVDNNPNHELAYQLPRANNLDDVERFNRLAHRSTQIRGNVVSEYQDLSDKLKNIRSRPEEFTEEVLKEAFLAMDVYLVNKE